MEDMANIQKLGRQALKTFRTSGGTSPSKKNIDILKSMIESITAADLNLNDPSKDRRRNFPGAPPVSHVNILESPYFSMAIFIVNSGKKLPLHNHPGMYGLCKVLYGSIQVKIYDKLDREGCERPNGNVSCSPEYKTEKVILCGETIFDTNSSACMVTPSCGNYHSITAVNGTAAFLDILGPPYATEKGRDCLYYKETHSERIPLECSENGESNIKYLVEIPCPPEFFCNSQIYEGPEVKLEDLIKACDEE